MAVSVQEAIVVRLLSAGANITAKDSRGNTTLHLAVTSELPERKFKKLFKLAPSTTAAKSVNNEGETVLHRVVTSRTSEELTRWLFDLGADIEAKNNGGETVLHKAVISFRSELITRLLLELGADVNARDCEEATALHQATAGGRRETVQSLCEHGADIDAKDSSGRTALHISAAWGDIMMVKLLLSYKPKIEERDYKGNTAASLAAAKGHDEIAQLFPIRWSIAHQESDDCGTIADLATTMEVLEERPTRCASEAYMSDEEVECESVLGLGEDIEDDRVLDRRLSPKNSHANIDAKYIQLDICKEICKELEKGIEPSGNQIVIVQIHWDLPNFRRTEIEEHAVFGSLLTISGTTSNAYATSCEEYLTRYWPESGRKTLNALQAAIARETKGSESLNLEITENMLTSSSAGRGVIFWTQARD